MLRYCAFWSVLVLFTASAAQKPEPVAPLPPAEAVSSFVAFPQDCNANPPMVFGGKLLAEMDRAAGMATRRFLLASPCGARDAVTIAINKVTFHAPARVKDLIVVTGRVVGAGAKSVTVRVTVEKEVEGKRELLVDGEFVFVAYKLGTDDKKGRAIPHGLTMPGEKDK